MTRFRAVLAEVAVACLPLLAHAACASKSARPADVVQAQHVAYAAHNLDAFAACYANDVVISFPSSKHPPIVGIAALRAEYAKLFNAVNKDFRSEYLKEIVNGPIVVVLEREIDPPPNMHMPKLTVAMFEVRDGKIVRVWFPPYK